MGISVTLCYCVQTIWLESQPEPVTVTGFLWFALIFPGKCDSRS
jgi:hypothetical protein